MLALALLFQNGNCNEGLMFTIGLIGGAMIGWKLKPSPTIPVSPFMECPNCHEPIRAGSTVCKHCHSALTV